MVEEGERAENGSHRLLWIVWCRGYGMKLLRWPAMVGLRMGDDEGEDLVDGKEWSEKWCWEDWRRTSLDFKKRKRLLKLQKWVCSCSSISHKVRILVHFRTEILGRDREHAFWKMLTEAISHKGVGWCEIPCVLAFLPYFPLFSPWLHSSSFPTCMLTQKPIQTTLEWN